MTRLSSARCKRNAALRAPVFQEFQAKHRCLPQSVGVWIGPEGDFAPEELDAIQAAGALPISLAGWSCASRPRRFIAFPSSITN
jgi:16S rRNA U1498 N3-methylase RsmE